MFIKLINKGPGQTECSLCLTGLYAFILMLSPFGVLGGKSISWLLNNPVLEKGVRCQAREGVKYMARSYVYIQGRDRDAEDT